MPPLGSANRVGAPSENAVTLSGASKPCPLLSMRIPIFSHRSNPAIDKPILRKKLGYIQSLIAERQAFWVDDQNMRLGVQLRAKLLETRDDYEYDHDRIIGHGFDTAWHIRQSGWDGPLVWQLRTQRV